jgi:hypothetical protein
LFYIDYLIMALIVLAVLVNIVNNMYLKGDIKIMKMMKKLLLIACGGLLFTAKAQATPIELVTNGEFEEPEIASNGWAVIDAADVPGWGSSTGALEIWGADFSPNAQPELGSDGLAHGQSRELTQRVGLPIEHLFNKNNI